MVHRELAHASHANVSLLCRPDDVSLACSNAVSPILLSFAKKGQHSAGFFGQQISRIIYKIGALYATLLTALVSTLSNGPWGMLLGLGFCGMLSIVLTVTTYQLGREVAQRIEQVIWTTGMLLGLHTFSAWPVTYIVRVHMQHATH